MLSFKPSPYGIQRCSTVAEADSPAVKWGKYPNTRLHVAWLNDRRDTQSFPAAPKRLFHREFRVGCDATATTAVWLNYRVATRDPRCCSHKKKQYVIQRYKRAVGSQQRRGGRWRCPGRGPCRSTRLLLISP
ncbi:hypothetical protein TGRH88_059430 [Toxoplasma gondii]|uniref:Uncharacterized protein n=1 Tax=Toxoplasma gondii TaxID=5811 RepID=A0A7J6JVK3_TOXGO|nr:hypothetical protein TGRH88_059430 [Toxoplasma gondii]